MFRVFKSPTDCYEDKLTKIKLADFTDDELITFLDNNHAIDLRLLSGICSEVLRRMNKIKRLLPEDGKDGMD